MDQERPVDIEQVTRAMDATRRSIQDTVEEIRDRVHERADWRHYVVTYPVASLVVSAVGGLALASVLVPAVRMTGLPLLLLSRIARRPHPPSRVAAALTMVSAARSLAGRLANVPTAVARIRQDVGRRRAGKQARD